MESTRISDLKWIFVVKKGVLSSKKRMVKSMKWKKSVIWSQCYSNWGSMCKMSFETLIWKGTIHLPHLSCSYNLLCFANTLQKRLLIAEGITLTSLSQKKVRQWCQNKTPEKTKIKTPTNWWLGRQWHILSLSKKWSQKFQGEANCPSFLRGFQVGFQGVPILDMTSPGIHTAFTDSHNFCWRSKDSVPRSLQVGGVRKCFCGLPERNVISVGFLNEEKQQKGGKIHEFVWPVLWMYIDSRQSIHCKHTWGNKNVLRSSNEIEDSSSGVTHLFVILTLCLASGAWRVFGGIIVKWHKSHYDVKVGNGSWLEMDGFLYKHMDLTWVCVYQN